MYFFNYFKKFFSRIDQFLFKIPFLGKKLYLRQFIRFLISGGLVTILDFAIYIFLTRFFWGEQNYLKANLLAMILAAVVSFYFNKFWVFKNRTKKTIFQHLKFWIIGVIGGMILYQFLLFVFVERFLVYDILAKILAVFVVMFFRFFIQKLLVFK